MNSLNKKLTPSNSLLILYGTQTGTCKLEAIKLSKLLNSFIAPCRIHPMDDYQIRNLPNESCVILMAATTGRGDPPMNMISFWRRIMNSSLSENTLSKVAFSVFGFGDSSYEKYNFVARALGVRMAGLGASEIIERGLGDDSRSSGYHKVLKKWVSRLLEKFLSLYLGICGQEKNHFEKVKKLLSDHGNLNQFFQNSENLVFSNQNNSSENQSQKIKKIVEKILNQSSKNIPFEIRHSPHEIILDKIDFASQGFENLEIESNKLITEESHFQKVFQLKMFLTLDKKEELNTLKSDSNTEKYDLKISDPNTNPQPGNCLQIIYQNDPKIVEQLTPYLKTESSQIRISIKPKHAHYYHPLLNNKTLSLNNLLSNYLDIARPISFEALKHLPDYCEIEEIYQEKLTEMDYQDYVEYVYREKRRLDEILFDFRAKNLDVNFLIAYLPMIRPREYSIASCWIDKSQNRKCIPIL